jgi:predicted amidohydrolase
MRTGVFQCAGGGLAVEERLERLDCVLKEQSLDLVVCPELFLSGYNIESDFSLLAQPQDGFFLREVTKIATARETAVVYGYPERCADCSDGLPYNAAAVVSAEGQLLANHRKLVIPPGIEAGRFQTGDALTLFTLGGVRIALLICYDVEFAETARAAALAGAEVILAPTALGDQWAVVAQRLIPTRAFENGAWVIYANHAGDENGIRYLGQSCIVDPLGQERARAGADECLITTTIDVSMVAAARKKLPYLADLGALSGKLKTR